MSGLNKYFDKIFCVNLDRRPDKWALSELEFKKYGIDVERFSAVDGNTLTQPPGGCKINAAEMGCSLSHIAILKRMISEGWQRILIVEDDVEFAENVNTLFPEYVKQVPPNWDMLYLGGNHIGAISNITLNVAKMSKTYSTSHYGITANMTKHVIGEIEKIDAQIDVTYTKFRTRNCYVFTPVLAWQKAGFSDIQGAFMDYTKIMKK